MDIPCIIFEDTEMLVLYKPAGMTVNRSDTTKEEITLQDWLGKTFSHIYTTVGIDEITKESDFYKRNGIVHRLDKETSGIILVAKTLHAFEELQRQFKERLVKKTYLALAHGSILPEEGSISVPVGRLTFNRKRFGVVAGGREAVTKYHVLKLLTLQTGKNKEVFSLVRLSPETGRTHQIRVHLKYLNHPIVSDELYAGRKTARSDRRFLHRLFLHAAEITFLHPARHEEMSFEAALPDDLEQFLNKLGDKIL